ncbi:MAG: hypothetical protein H7288_12240, partial [Kineosporiaceae bacterium]|nr:hypothetical protein [Aeromicrobium sp.]
ASTGAVTLTWKGNWDRDNGTLTYKVLRGSTVVGQVVRTAPFWQIPTLTFTDTGAPRGLTVQYRIQALDPWANAVTSDPVNATIPGGGPLAVDRFSRAVTGSLGTAETGGAWTVSGSNTSFAVDGSRGSIALPAAGSSRTALLSSVSALNLEVTVDLGMDKAASGENIFMALMARANNASNNYRAKLVLRPAGDVQVQLTKVVAGVETSIKSAALPGVAHSSGGVYTVRFRVTGTNPTTLQAKVWPAGGVEPLAWAVQVSDSSAGLQTAGGVGFWSYVSGSANSTPQTVIFDNLNALPIR